MPEGNPRRPWPHRLRPRLSVRALMVLVLVLGVWLGWVVNRARIQRDLFAALRAGGGWGQYEFKGRYKKVPLRTTSWPQWLQDSLGVDYFYSIVGIKYHTAGADEIAGRLARLGELETVVFNASDLSDSGLARLEGLDPFLLQLSGTKVTDAGLGSLRGMTNLENLSLSGTAVRGAVGMAHVATLSKLEILYLNESRISDAGLEPLSKLRALKCLDLSYTSIGDKGAAHLKSMSGLKWLKLDRTLVTASMIMKLKAALPGASISPDPDLITFP